MLETLKRAFDGLRVSWEFHLPFTVSKVVRDNQEDEEKNYNKLYQHNIFNMMANLPSS